MLRLHPMTQGQFDQYLATAVAGYALAHTKAGDCEPDEAMELAQKDYDQLLPNGLASVNHYLYSAIDDAEDNPVTVGMIWFQVKEGKRRTTAFIYDFNVRDDLQGKGYGTRLMKCFEEAAMGLGVSKVSLNVFGYNHSARALYEKLGYEITGIGMTKVLMR